ncbi:hypothetical protein NE237_026288 [Protea cynaroides]|uniref:Uncharacterized protein n=1 Tax=Protea cynaroides TaxID=273540 RepID=A0A9Q0K1B8_9MAGN|nr:hypothetical protein NE237_026288 [Protea cynaroides]
MKMEELGSMKEKPSVLAFEKKMRMEDGGLGSRTKKPSEDGDIGTYSSSSSKENHSKDFNLQLEKSERLCQSIRLVLLEMEAATLLAQASLLVHQSWPVPGGEMDDADELN